MTTDVSNGRGFAGARFVPITDLERRAKPGDVVFFGTQSEVSRAFGATNEGAPEQIRRASARMFHWSDSLSTVFWDIGLLTGRGQELLEDILVTSSSLRGLGLVPAMVACDHLASYGAMRSVSDETAYIYFDAHYDLGLHDGPDGLHNGNFVGSLLSALPSSQIVNIGARSWTGHASPYRSLPAITTIDGRSAASVIDALSQLELSSVYVSIDADALDPAIFPYSCCPEPFGMSHHNMLEICQWLGRNFAILGCDLSELNPSLDADWASEAMMRILASLFED